MSLAEELVRLPQSPAPVLPEPERPRAPKRNPRLARRRRVVATMALASLWCTMAVAGIWMAQRQATMNQISFELTDLQDKIATQEAQNKNLQAQIQEKSSQSYVLSLARERLHMRPPTAAEMQVLPMDQAKINPTPTQAAPSAAAAPAAGVTAWIGEVMQNVRGAVEAHK